MTSPDDQSSQTHDDRKGNDTVKADATDHDQVATIVARYRQELARSSETQLASYVETYRVASDESNLTLVGELAAVDLNHRMTKNERIKVEHYLEKWPELRANKSVVFSLVKLEWNFYSSGDTPPDLDEYKIRFPELCDEIESMFSDLDTMAPVSCPVCRIPLPSDASHQSKIATCHSCNSTIRIDSAESLPIAAKASQFGKFKLIEKVGQGAFGQVFRGIDTSLNRTVAIKIPRGEAANELQRLDFLNEAQNVARLKHEGIVPVYEIGSIDKGYYIVSEFVSGPTLDESIKSGNGFDHRQTAELGIKIANALEHAHQQNIVHRDLKPANVLMEQQSSGRPIPRITDFGMALRTESEVVVDSKGKVLGTPAYMSPEQASGRSDQAGPTSDIYSLGVILYEMLGGERPFRGNLSRLLEQIQHEMPRELRLLNDRIPKDLETITTKCLAKEPARRYESARELAEDLQRYLDSKPIQARPVSQSERVVLWCKRKPWTATWIAVASLALLVALISTTVGYIVTSNALFETQIAKLKVDENFELARGAVDDLLITISEESLLGLSGMKPVREELLNRALVYYQKFAEMRSDETSLDVELGMAHYKTGLIQSEIRSQEEAIASFQKALTLQQKLLASVGENSKLQDALGDTFNALGRAYARLGDLPLAEANFLEAESIRESLTKQDSENETTQINYLRKYANSLMNHGVIGQDADTKVAVKLMDQAQAIRSEILSSIAASKLPKKDFQKLSQRVTRDLGKGHYGFAKIAMIEEDQEEESRRLKKAIERFRQAIEQNPRDIESQILLAFCLRLMGDQVGRTDDVETAMSYYAEATDLLEPLSALNADDVDVQTEHARLLLNRSLLEFELSRPLQAYPYAMKATMLLRSIVFEKALTPELQNDFLRANKMVAEILVKQGEMKAAITHLETFLGDLENLKGLTSEPEKVAIQFQLIEKTITKLKQAVDAAAGADR